MLGVFLVHVLCDKKFKRPQLVLADGLVEFVRVGRGRVIGHVHGFERVAQVRAVQEFIVGTTISGPLNAARLPENSER